jgi:hypothetical protein
MYLKDPNSGQPSPTVTVFVVGAAVCMLKLLSSGIMVGSVQLAQFSGTEFGIAIGALGAIYVMRKKPEPPKDAE